MKILVTGGAWFIGTHTLIELDAAGHEMVVVDNLINSNRESLRRVAQIIGKEIPFYQTDIRDREGLNKVFEDHSFDCCIHFAGLKAVGESVQKPLEYYYITNCIDFQRLDQKGDMPLTINTDNNNLLILGTDFFRKGVDIALKAIEPIADKHNICLQIVSHYPEITEQKVKESLGYQPSWVAVLLTTELVGDNYRQSQLFLSPSRNEGLSYAIPEAIYCGCLPIKSDIPSLTYNL